MPFLNDVPLPAISFRYGGKNSADFLASWLHAETSQKKPDHLLTRRVYNDDATGLRVTVEAKQFDCGMGVSPVSLAVSSPAEKQQQDRAETALERMGKMPMPHTGGTPVPRALEWIVYFENRGKADTPIIENILPLDATTAFDVKEKLTLHHAKGSLCNMDDFLPQTTEIAINGWPRGPKKTLSCLYGRSSNGTLPFMNLQRKGGGMILAIGWSGQWAASFERTNDSLHVTAGMERTHLVLRPGEKIRTPRILTIDWQGDDAEIGNNLLRRVMIAHYLPRIDGELVMPPAAQCIQWYYYFTGKAGEEFEYRALETAKKVGITAYWIDACWYGNTEGDQADWAEQVGSWEVNRKRFPNGLRPISDAARKAGMKFVLWFEPERVRAGSQLAKEHPEFLLDADPTRADAKNLLLNLGNPDARKYMTDTLSAAIEEHGVSIFRQDFNFEPFPYWDKADAPDRAGMTEIRYVEGLYEMWDELLRRHKGLSIDNCASGGRRIDLETCSRSLPLWPSDFFDTCGPTFGLNLNAGDQCINLGLARWVPLFGGGVWSFNPYSSRSEIIGGFTFGGHIDFADLNQQDGPTAYTGHDMLGKTKCVISDDFPVAAAKAAIDEWKSLRPFFIGDFHVLVPITVSSADWCAYQFHRADLHAGFAMFFRRQDSPFATMEAKLKNIDPAATYEVSLSEGYTEGPRRKMNGKELANQTIAISQKPGSVLLRYRRV